MKLRWPGFTLEPFDLDLLDLEKTIAGTLKDEGDAKIVITKTVEGNTTTITTKITTKITRVAK